MKNSWLKKVAFTKSIWDLFQHGVRSAELILQDWRNCCYPHTFTQWGRKARINFWCSLEMALATAVQGLARLNEVSSSDWTADNGVYTRYKVWKRKLELIFKGLLEGPAEKRKVKYLVLWSGDYKIALVDKWTEEGRLVITTDVDVDTGKVDKDKLTSYWAP